MTTEELFKNKIDEITISLDDKEQKFIESKHNNLREKLREILDLKDDFLTGSYKRRTQIKPRKTSENFDVDIFLAFNKEDYGEKELKDLMVEVENTVKDIKDNNNDIGITFINTKQRRSIGVEFGEKFQIDLVPAIEIEKDQKYKIFDKNTQQAIESNPKLHGNNLTSANETTESGSARRLIPIVKLLKSWKRDKCEYIKSFHLEMLLVEILGNEKINSYSQGLAKFFTNAEQYLQSAGLEDPANKENIIDEYLDDDGKRSELLDLIADEKEIAERAIEFENENADDNAVKEWKKIFESNDEKIAQAIKSGNFYSRTGGVIINTNLKSPNGKRIDSPNSWKS